MRKKLMKTGCKVVFTSAFNLKSTLCSYKSKIVKERLPVVYQLRCNYGEQNSGETSTKKIACEEDKNHQMP